MSIDHFNSLLDSELRQLLTACLAVSRWVDEVASKRPYDDKAAALAHASSSAQQLSDTEVTEALRRHPRIGEQLPSADSESALSRREQSGVDQDAATQAALRAGNIAYEQKFNRVFLIRAAGRSATEILGELQRRMTNDAEREKGETTMQLREIALLRLEALLDELGGGSTTPEVEAP